MGLEPLSEERTQFKTHFKGGKLVTEQVVLEPGWLHCFRSCSNSNTLTHPAREQVVRLENGAGPPRHGLSSDTMVLITSDYGIMCSLRIKWP